VEQPFARLLRFEDRHLMGTLPPPIVGNSVWVPDQSLKNCMPPEFEVCVTVI
jgi:hypothetical protein